MNILYIENNIIYVFYKLYGFYYLNIIYKFL